MELVRSFLAPPLRTPFFEQAPEDQRHGVEAAGHVISAGIENPEVVTAALVHDIGKRHARLGVSGRVLASLMIRARLPLPSRFRAYRDHGPVAAEELTALGAPGLAVEFARHHHGPRPRSIQSVTWEILIASDQPAKTEDGTGAGISSFPT
ncbi:MAG: hypothetical protein ACRDVL_11670 [Acidimicrobiia bacterium]